MTATSMKRVICSMIVLPVLAAMSAISTAAPAPKSIALPGGPPAGMDYLAYDAATGRVWVPAGNTGNVDVLDVATGKLTTLGRFRDQARVASRPAGAHGRAELRHRR